MTAHEAIELSCTYDEIVTIDFDEDGHYWLVLLSEDSVDVTKQCGVTEFCGTDDDGNHWRVHMRAQEEKEIDHANAGMCPGFEFYEDEKVK